MKRETLSKDHIFQAALRASPALDTASIAQAVLVAEHSSFRRAASVLGTSPSVLSRRVRSLEDAIGVSLFERRSTGVRVTAAGRRFFNTACSALAELGLAVREAGSAGRGAEGCLHIGVFASLGSMFARDAIAAFARRHPNVKIDIAEGGPSEHLAALQDQRLDVAFLGGSPVGPGLQAEIMWSERITVALPEGHPLVSEDSLRWEALRGEHFLVSRAEPGPTAHDHVIQHLADLGHHPDVEAHAVSREALVNLVGLGFGVSVLSEAASAVRYPGVVYRFIQDDTVRFSAVWSPVNVNPVRSRFLSLAQALARGRRLPDPPQADPTSGTRIRA